jgi:hypothetical protein
MQSKTNQRDTAAWLRARTVRRVVCTKPAAGERPFAIVFQPYHFANGKAMSESADFYPNARATQHVFGTSADDAVARFEAGVNREVKAVHEVTV